MKKTVPFILFICFCNISFAQETDNYIQSLNVMKKEGLNPAILGYFSKPFKKSKFGVWAFAYGEKGYGELLGGLTFDVSKSFQIALGSGAEAYDKNIYHRVGAFLYFEKDKWVLSAYAETGQSGVWYLGYVDYSIYRSFGIGINGQPESGIGPRLRFDLIKKSLVLSVSAGYLAKSEYAGVLNLAWNF